MNWLATFLQNSALCKIKDQKSHVAVVYCATGFSLNCILHLISEGARFSAPVQTGPGAHPASYAMDTGSLPGVKRPGRGVDYPPSSNADVKERVELYLYSPSGSSWPVLG
jgi:hypothetical protein